LGRVMSAACMDGTKRKITMRIMGVNSLKDACFNSPIFDPRRPRTGSESANQL